MSEPRSHAPCLPSAQVLAENDEWITGMMEMEVGAQDPTHNHKDHLIYVLGGDQVTIHPGGADSGADPLAVDIKVGAGIPAPMDAPPFAKHSLKNTGKTPLKVCTLTACLREGATACSSSHLHAAHTCVHHHLYVSRCSSSR